MNKIISFFSILFCSTAIEAQAQTIDIQATGLADNTKLQISLTGTYVPADPIQTVTVRDGKALFKLQSDGIRAYNIMIPDTYGYFMLVLDKDEHAKVSVQVADESKTQSKYVTRKTDKPYYQYQNLKVTGSAAYDFYLAHKADRAALDARYNKFHEDAADVLAKMQKAGRGSAEYRQLVKSPEYKAYLAADSAFFSVVDSVLMAPVYANKNTQWGPLFLTTEMTYLTENQYPIYEQFSDEAKQSFYGKVVQGFVAPVSVKGIPMPNFTFTDHQTGKKTSLYEVCKKSKYVLIDFWASWCGPCRREIPNFKSQYDLYHKKGFDIVSISADSKEADWIKALNEEKLPWPNDIDGRQGICKLYKVAAYPTVYILDSEGKVVAKDMEARGENLRKLLAELFR